MVPSMVPQGQEVQSMEGHENYVFCVNFNNPQANLLVSARKTVGVNLGGDSERWLLIE